MASNRFKLIYSSSDDAKPTQNTPLEELKEKGVQTPPKEEPTVVTPKFCSHCGKEGEIYNGLIPVRGLKPYAWLLCVLFIALVWVYVWWYAQNDGATSSWIINIGLIVSPIALSLCALLVMRKLSAPHPGQAVICHDCCAAFPLSEAPRFTQGWDMDKFMLVLHGQDKKSRRRKAMAEKLAKKAGMSVSDMRENLVSTPQKSKQDAVQGIETDSSVEVEKNSPTETTDSGVQNASDTEGYAKTHETQNASDTHRTTPEESPTRALTPEEIGIAAAHEARKPNKNSMLGRLF